MPSLLPAPAALTDRPLLGQALFVGFAVGAHARLGLGGGIVQRRGVRAAVVPEFLVQRILVRHLVADTPPVDLLALLLPAAHLLREAVALLLQFGERLQVDEHALLVGPAPHHDLRRDEGDHQHQIGDQRDAQPDTVVVRPLPGILPAVVERQAEACPARTAFRRAGVLSGGRASPGRNAPAGTGTPRRPGPARHAVRRRIRPRPFRSVPGFPALSGVLRMLVLFRRHVVSGFQRKSSVFYRIFITFTKN